MSGDDKKKALEGHFANTLKTGFYVRSTGTCNGDSGGPVFVKSESRVVLLSLLLMFLSF